MKKEREIPFMQLRYLFFGVSIALMGLAIFFLFQKGLKYGTDFEGGLSLLYEFDNPVTVHAVEEALQASGKTNFVAQEFGESEGKRFVIKAKLPEEQTDHSGNDFTKSLEASFPGVKLLKEEFVGPKVGQELREKGLWAVVWAWVVMLLYVGFRFDFYFAPGALFALVHDVLIALGAFAFSGREVNLTVVAAFLTIVGYSINDTIIVFDRIRENATLYKGSSLVSVINRSLTQILMRTLITSLTVFFAVLVLFLRAEGDIQDFAYAMIWGVVAGTYSSIFVASPIYLFLKRAKSSA
ncbi:MAG: protein translocase subunit SecF [Deltaproteobacteria bacterium]|nr:protein translocase subunit SecF [Deltaproteobacteria bacterium]